ncbi:DUF433 domain-containing protein [Spirosoma montaniterrae]|uniref:Antitoxin n=1 Tax=Spirosoma montaniterrae TaxID=1178516 RepID=A0A1P9X1B4_9BACT|nr:DUF433 domain-containing protein [Spirosoma montaniterrae]AQG81426.1 hypothetical protein AWR27_20150 [Spirosoma montaniterrae]
MNWRNYIHTDPAILAGKPIIKGTRLSVELILERLANGWTEAMLLESYPTLSKEALPAVYAFMLETIRDDVFKIHDSLRQAS